MKSGDSSRDARGRRGTEGAVFVEFLIAFLPVFTMFLCLLQLALLFSVRLVVDHAAANTARAAAVVIGDDPETYGEPGKMPKHNLPKGSERFKTIRRAAILSLAPFIADGTINDVRISFLPPGQPGGKPLPQPPSFSPINMQDVAKIRVRLEVEAACKMPIANRITCGKWIWGFYVPTVFNPSKTFLAEAVYPYQGARYEYPK
jgi:hypothetical protein